MSALGVVVIGRNEGERLIRCLDSVRRLSELIVYVDSGSTDGSIAAARARGADVLELDLARPFTAARARNEGFERLMARKPDLEYVFFVDGDCEVVPGWLEKATGFLVDHPEVGVVSGVRQERFPERSIYNLLIDMEWSDYPVGDVKLCGGDALMRTRALREVGGYRSDLICGEEPEMCIRLRSAGWRVWRLNEAMALHDAAMYRFSQWWKREIRTGYAFAQGKQLHGSGPDRHSVAESRRSWLWGLAIPVTIFLLAVGISLWNLLLFALYPVQVARIALKGKRSVRLNWFRAAGLVIGKFPEMLGQLKFLSDRVRGAQSGLIEYK